MPLDKESSEAKDILRKFMAENKNLSRKQASVFLGVSIVTLDRAIAKGNIGFFRIGRRVIFGQSHLENFLLSNEVKVKLNKREQNLGLAR